MPPHVQESDWLLLSEIFSELSPPLVTLVTQTIYFYFSLIGWVVCRAQPISDVNLPGLGFRWGGGAAAG